LSAPVQDLGRSRVRRLQWELGAVATMDAAGDAHSQQLKPIARRALRTEAAEACALPFTLRLVPRAGQTAAVSSAPETELVA
jgi:hypothetical protein